MWYVAVILQAKMLSLNPAKKSTLILRRPFGSEVIDTSPFPSSSIVPVSGTTDIEPQTCNAKQCYQTQVNKQGKEVANEGETD